MDGKWLICNGRECVCVFEEATERYGREYQFLFVARKQFPIGLCCFDS